MNHKELEKLLLKKHKFVLIGEENYLIHYALRFLKKSLNPEFALFNDIEIDQKNIAYDEAMLQLEAVPMMDTKKIVHIRNFNFALEGNPWSKKELQDFAEKIQYLPPESLLVLSNENMSKPGNAKLLKDYSKLLDVILLERLPQKDLLLFAKDYLAVHEEVEIAPSVLSLLLEMSGYLQKESKVDLFAIKTMLNKTASFYRAYGKVDASDVRMLFEEKPQGDIFRLIDAIAAGKKEEAFQHYSGLRNKGEANIKIMVTVGKIFSTAVKSSYYTESGYSGDEIARELKKSPYAIRSANNLLRKLGRTKLIGLIDVLLEVDYKMKAGALDDSVYGELALMKMFELIESANR